jgi:tRNA(fMet)-specific endonuclease VapC
MSYLLDANTCIAYLNDRNSPITHRMTTIKPTDIFLCQIVKAELYYGAYKSARRQENLALLKHFFGQFGSLPFNEGAAETYGRIRAELATQGLPVGPNDLIIAAIALGSIKLHLLATIPASLAASTGYKSRIG